MCCSLKAIISCGMILGVIDVFHGLVTSSFYVYQFIYDYFYLCPIDLVVKTCHYKQYIFNQLFKERVKYGIGEGLVSVLFAVIYIITVVKRVPGLPWIWLLKALSVIGLNIAYLAYWLTREDVFDYIEIPDDEYIFIYMSVGLTTLQGTLIVLFCIITSIYTQRVYEERAQRKQRLRNRGKWGSSDATASPIGQFEDDEAQYLNDALTSSEKTLPTRSPRQSMNEISRAETLKHSTGV